MKREVQITESSAFLNFCFNFPALGGNQTVHAGWGPWVLTGITDLVTAPSPSGTGSKHSHDASLKTRISLSPVQCLGPGWRDGPSGHPWRTAVCWGGFLEILCNWVCTVKLVCSALFPLRLVVQVLHGMPYVLCLPKFFIYLLSWKKHAKALFAIMIHLALFLKNLHMIKWFDSNNNVKEIL